MMLPEGLGQGQGQGGAAGSSHAGSTGAEGSSSSSSSNRVLKEAAILSSLHHPNIVTYYESFVEGGCCEQCRRTLPAFCMPAGLMCTCDVG